MAAAPQPVSTANVGQQPTQPGQVQQVMEQFRPLADTVKQLGSQYPEGQEEAVQIMKALQSWMAKVAGNPQRVPDAQAPPNA
jgi:transcription initiation factor TFIID subunit TAF12